MWTIWNNEELGMKFAKGIWFYKLWNILIKMFFKSYEQFKIMKKLV